MEENHILKIVTWDEEQFIRTVRNIDVRDRIIFLKKNEDGTNAYFFVYRLGEGVSIILQLLTRKRLSLGDDVKILAIEDLELVTDFREYVTLIKNFY
ncbi:MAG: hypothetical protein ACTSXJ_01170 [Candidatus Baldrarchaeia archaeon]